MLLRKKNIKSLFSDFSNIAGIFVMVMGLLVMGGMAFKFPVIKYPFPYMTGMKFNTALLFFFTGLSLWLLKDRDIKDRELLEKKRKFGRGIAFGTLALSFLTFIQYPLGFGFGIDTLLMYEPPGLPGTTHAGRMDIPSATSFMLLSVCLLLIDNPKLSAQKISECFIASTVTLAMFCLAAYSYRSDLYNVIPIPIMAIHTSATFIILSIGIFTARPRIGIMNVFRDIGPAGLLIRRFLPAAVFIPLISGYLIFKSENLIDYDFRFGLIIMAMISVVGFSIMVIWNARTLFEIDSERRKVIDQLTEAKEAAEIATRAKSDFLASMSHEIRTPMNAVIGLANILMRSSPLTDKQMQFITTLQVSANTLMSLINDLLDISKIESSNIQLEHIDFNIVNLVNEIAAMMKIKADEKKIGLETTFAAENPHYRGDPVRIRQIVTNLVGNAIKFTASGKVSIDVISTEGDKAGHDDILIIVSDTGIGIPQNKLTAIFEKFAQADISTTRKYGGTGLGLAISKGLAELMDGDIWAESIPGKGAKFTVKLPLQKGEPEVEKSEAKQTNAPPPAPSQETTILLVEDYEPNILVAGTMLSNFGYNYDVARNGLEALEMFGEKQYKLVIMDVQMPEMDGLEATRRIRKKEEGNGYGHVIIIGMTAHALTDARGHCLEAGMDNYISKPFNPLQLKNLLEKYLRPEFQGHTAKTAIS